MAKMHFKYASMNSGKSIDLIRTAHNYEENGYKTLIISPNVNKNSNGKISSRIGLDRQADIMLLYSDDVLEVLKGELKDISVILVDEAQFLGAKQVEDLFLISKAINIPVICYGLRTNFKMESFSGSKRLLELSEVLEELTTLCKCGQIARFVGRKVGENYVKEGEEVIIKGTDNITYEPLCGKCYLTKVEKIDLDQVKKSLIRGSNE